VRLLGENVIAYSGWRYMLSQKIKERIPSGLLHQGFRTYEPQ
jgi:hypothetical protein